MHSRERVRFILNHQQTDRPAVDLGSTRMSGTSAWIYRALKRALGLPEGRVRVIDAYQMLAAEMAWKIVGTHGSLRLWMTAADDKKILLDRACPAKGVVSEILWEGPENGEVCHTGPLRDFAEAIRYGRPPRTGLEQALIVQQITDAIYASAERGVAVEIA